LSQQVSGTFTGRWRSRSCCLRLLCELPARRSYHPGRGSSVIRRADRVDGCPITKDLMAASESRAGQPLSFRVGGHSRRLAHAALLALQAFPNAQLTLPVRARRARRQPLRDVPEPSIAAPLDSVARFRRHPAIESEGRMESSFDTSSPRRDLRPPIRQVAGALYEHAVTAPAASL
jgi:hypothetical protein